jgi:hypothetical protein
MQTCRSQPQAQCAWCKTDDSYVLGWCTLKMVSIHCVICLGTVYNRVQDMSTLQTLDDATGTSPILTMDTPAVEQWQACDYR